MSSTGPGWWPGTNGAGSGAGRCCSDHYLEVLARKPGALPGSMALSLARAAGVFTVAHEAFWTRARHQHGDSDGTRALIEVLLLHRHLPAAAVTAGIRAALTVGSTSPELVTVEARRAASDPHQGRDDSSDPDGTSAADATVLRLPSPPAGEPADEPGSEPGGEPAGEGLADVMRHKLAGLPGERPLPSVAHYDELLARGSAGSRRPSRPVTPEPRLTDRLTSRTPN